MERPAEELTGTGKDKCQGGRSQQWRPSMVLTERRLLDQGSRTWFLTQLAIPAVNHLGKLNYNDLNGSVGAVRWVSR